MILMITFSNTGDPTEDPRHPKIIWPSATDCPNCRTDRMDLFNLDPQIAFVEGQLWNLTRLVKAESDVKFHESCFSVVSF